MGWKEELQRYYDTHDTMNDDNRHWLAVHTVMQAELLDDLSREQLVEIFSPDGGELNHTLLMRTLVWQSLGQILSHQLKPIRGNIRAFWYDLSDPLYSKNDLYKDVTKSVAFQDYMQSALEVSPALLDLPDGERQLQVSRDYVQDLSDDVLADFVLQRIFRYQGPFEFADTNAQYRLPGEGPASLVFFVEKQGLWDKYCVEYYQQRRISVLASKGFPSFVTLEYFADQLHARKIKNVALAGLVDYDPAGYGIFDDYVKKFQFYGFGIKNQTLLTGTDIFTEQTLENKSYDLEHVAPNKEKQTQAWFQATGGIHGKRRGCHVNNAMKGRVDKKVDLWIKGQLS